MKKLILIVFGALFMASCAKEPQLALNLEKGKDYKLSQLIDVTVIQEFGGEQMEIVITVMGGMNYHVVDIQDDAYQIEASYDSLGLKSVLPIATMEFSSEEENKEHMVSKILGAMRHKTFNIKMGRDGKIIEVSNINEMFSTVFKEFPELDASQVDQLTTQLNQSYGSDAFKGNMEMAVSVFPDTSVNVGDSWEVKTELNSASLKADVVTVYTLKEILDGNFILEGKSKISSNEDGQVDIDGVNMSYDLDGEMTSNITIDGKSGWILDAKINQEVKGTTTMAPNEELPEGLSMPVNMKIEMQVKGS